MEDELDVQVRIEDKVSGKIDAYYEELVKAKLLRKRKHLKYLGVK